MSTNRLWHDLYAAAMLELDLAALPAKIETAQAAIRQAMKEPKDDNQAGTLGATQAMADALRNLQTLPQVEFRTSTQIPALNASQGQSLAEG
jgi:hypothetical protein